MYWISYNDANGQSTCYNVPGTNATLVNQTEYFINRYRVNRYWHRLQQSTNSTYDNNTEISTITDYYYDNPIHRQVTRTKTTTSNATTVHTQTWYPDDVTTNTSLGYDNLLTKEKTAIDKLKTQHRITTPVQVKTTVKKGSTTLSKTAQRTNYKDWGNNIVLPEQIQTLKGTYHSSTNPLKNKIEFIEYDTYGNPIEVSKTKGSPITYIWGYHHTYPVAKIENATHAQIKALAYFGTNFTINNGLSTAQENSLRTLPNALVTTYTYIPQIGLSSITDARGNKITYHYDDFNRLQYVTDKDGKILSENQYHYRIQN